MRRKQQIGIILALLLFAISAHAREVAVTFDDVPDVDDDLHTHARQLELTQQLLDALKTEGVPAIGFVNEEKVADDPQDVALLDAWRVRGFELGNHTWSHAELDVAGSDEFNCDVSRGDAITTRVLGHPPIWFRYPYLETGKTTQARSSVEGFLAQHGYLVAPVTIDDSDWIFARAYDLAHWWQRPAIRREYLAYMSQRFDWAEHESRLVFGREIPQILLLHASSLNADMWPELATLIRGRGYRFVSLADAMSDSAYASHDDWLGGGVGWIERWGVTNGMNELVFGGDPQVPAWIQEIAREHEDED